ACAGPARPLLARDGAARARAHTCNARRVSGREGDARGGPRRSASGDRGANAECRDRARSRTDVGAAQFRSPGNFAESGTRRFAQGARRMIRRTLAMGGVVIVVLALVAYAAFEV